MAKTDRKSNLLEMREVSIRPGIFKDITQRARLIAAFKTHKDECLDALHFIDPAKSRRRDAVMKDIREGGGRGNR